MAQIDKDLQEAPSNTLEKKKELQKRKQTKIQQNNETRLIHHYGNDRNIQKN